MSVSIAVVVSFSLLAFSGLLVKSSSEPQRFPWSDQRATANDWPEDYLNGTVTPIGWIHADIGDYQDDGVTIQGNVTAAPGEYDLSYFFVQDSTGGMMVNFSGSGFVFGVSRGDFVRLNGTVHETDEGMHTVETALSYWIMSTANTVDVEHFYNSSLVSDMDQGRLAKMNGYLTNFSYSNTSHSDPDWEWSVCVSTLWMYGRTFQVRATNMTLSDYEGFVMVSGIIFHEDDVFTLDPRSVSDITQGNGPYDTPNPDGDLSDWSGTEIAVDDSDDDSLVTDNEVRSYSVTWDAEYLHLSVDYTVTAGNSLLLYIDSIPGSGANNVSAIDWGTGDWSRHIEFFDGFAADLLLCRYGDGWPELWRILSNGEATDISTSLAAFCSGSADGSDSVIEAAIPWYEVYGLYPGRVPAGAMVRTVTVMTYGSNTNFFDCSPDSRVFPLYNDFGELYYFYDFCVDCDLDGYPDDYSTGFEIPEFSTLLVVPVMMAIVVLVSRSMRRKT